MSALTQTFSTILRLSHSFVRGDDTVDIVSDVETYHRQNGYRTIEILSCDVNRLKEIKTHLAETIAECCTQNARVHIQIPDGTYNQKPYISISIWRNDSRELIVE